MLYIPRISIFIQHFCFFCIKLLLSNYTLIKQFFFSQFIRYAFLPYRLNPMEKKNRETRSFHPVPNGEISSSEARGSISIFDPQRPQNFFPGETEFPQRWQNIKYSFPRYLIVSFFNNIPFWDIFIIPIWDNNVKRIFLF